MLFSRSVYLSVAVAALALCGPLAQAETLSLDAHQAPPAPRDGLLNMGTALSPSGQSLTVNDRYLMIDGKPVLPVMGEFHYTRFPHQYWEEQLLKMKAAGVNVVATYVIWQHHEEKPGVFDWSGDRDLRHFIELAHKHGLYVYLRPGPWAHAEVRFGGLPDWVVDSTPTRGNDPVYLSYVEAYYQQVFAQVRGLLWKDGGPVIGLQLENEYNRNGPMQGRDHIARLKQMAMAAGFDVPLYSVTGWDNAVFPRGEVIPVFGSYVDEPWSASTATLPPKTSYLFQFGVRNEQGLGAQGRTSTQDDGARDADITPFFGAEYGGGVPPMYRRRPLIAPEDISAMALTKVGSGVNLLGYYMFQGGQNPAGQPSRNETIATGSPNDVPRFGYDFQAPLGQYGQAHPVLNSLKPLHAFLQAFGDRLAPMAVYGPEVKPRAADDLETLRWAFRGDGQSGFLFVNNHIRQYATPRHSDVRFEIRLADRRLTLPAVTIEPGDNFLWPVQFDLSGVTLTYATAQPVTKISDGQGDLYVFATTGRIAPQFMFAADQAATVRGGTRRMTPDGVMVTPRLGEITTVTRRNGQSARFLTLSKAQAEHLSVLEVQGRPRLVLSEAEAFGGADGGIELRQTAPQFDLYLYPQPEQPLTASLKLTPLRHTSVFAAYRASAPEVRLTVTPEVLRPAGKAPALKMHGPRNTPGIPAPESFGAAAAWTLQVPPEALKDVADIFLDIRYEGDVARLFSGPVMLDDTYYDGRVWRIGLKRYANRLTKPLTVQIMPLREDSTIYLDPSVRPQFTDGQVARIAAVQLVPEYRLSVQ